jgi:hypothetical protein
VKHRDEKSPKREEMRAESGSRGGLSEKQRGRGELIRVFSRGRRWRRGEEMTVEDDGQAGDSREKIGPGHAMEEMEPL